jgi:hypothetical protein
MTDQPKSQPSTPDASDKVAYAVFVITLIGAAAFVAAVLIFVL